MRILALTLALVAATCSLAAADPANVPASSDLRTASITCAATYVYIWANNNNAPYRSDDAPLLLGSEISVYVPVRQSISQGLAQFYQTSIPIVEIAPHLAPTYYVPRNCVTITGSAPSPAPSPSRTPAAAPRT